MPEPRPTPRATAPKPGNGELPTPKPRVVICPYCGCRTEEAAACSQCRGRFEPLSRQATQNTMGPWWVRDERRPNTPGCNFSSLLKLIDAGSVGPESVIRGPTTRQFWLLARHTPGVANHLGVCHNCGNEAGAEDFSCGGCGAVFTIEPDRQFLGLGPVRELSGPSVAGAMGDLPRSEPSRQPFGGSPTKPLVPKAGGLQTSGTTGPPLVMPRPHRISQRRLAVNLMVGCAVFVLVVGLVLTTLNIMPSDLFKDRGLEIADTTTPAEPTGSPPGTAGIDRTPMAGAGAESLGRDVSGERQLLSFAAAGSGVQGNGLEPATEGEAAQAIAADDEPRPVVSAEQRVYERAFEVLRLGEPASIRQSILALDALLASPRVPDWAPSMRAQLQARLERLQFARLP
ncbi:MAG: hypothetical protein ACI89L_000210 [Phycisphaerales bacterium]|jgi:hypothetical protein